MSARRWKLLAAPVAMMALTAPLLVNCAKKPPEEPTAPTATAKGEVPTCKELETNDLKSLPIAAPQDAQDKMRRLLAAAREIGTKGKEVERELIEACTAIGKATGAGDEELRADPGKGRGAEQLCTLVSAKVKRMLEEAKNAKVELLIEMDLPRCYTDAGAVNKCLGECGSQAGGDVRASCAGGEISGVCKAHCNGTCIRESGAGLGFCHGVCQGRCDKDFRGACGGKCDGTCDGVPTKGLKKCAGICDGKCDKQADGLCNGKCDGYCSRGYEPVNHVKCEGQCLGTCASPVEEPLCSGDFTPQGADAVCMSICGGYAAIAARCETPLIRVTAKNGKQTPELQRLLIGLQTTLPKLVRTRQTRSKKLLRGMAGVVAGGVEMTNAYATAGARALFCVRVASDAIKEAEETIDVAIKGSEGIMGALQAGATVNIVNVQDRAP